MAALGNREVVKLLVSAGANVNALNAVSTYPLKHTNLIHSLLTFKSKNIDLC